MADASTEMQARLLGNEDPPPFTVYRADGASPFVLLADHAGQRVPRALAELGLPQAELDRHIGWDIGIDDTTRLLAGLLDAFAITQTYSRLVIDCNRPLDSPTSIVAASDGTTVPGNLGLDPAARQARIDEIFAPYHGRIAAELDARAAAGRPTVLIAMHSFTPRMNGFERPWHAGVLYNRDGRLAHALRVALQEEGLVVGDNEPYAISDTSDYAIPVHAEARGLLHVELEIRQDLIADHAGQLEWAERLARLLPPLAARLM
ncbi:N-formylglutamate amidohydrolase [[Pseudomonas] boreopolis]|uniref:N-formylglutamate amidohydrolase n=1 Tax=Xanthomonas boreopolis TaxID=86183 RepID=UPI003D9ADBC2